MSSQSPLLTSNQTIVPNKDADKDYINDFVKQIEQKLKERDLIRKDNLSTERPDVAYFTKLDTSVKKNTAFVRKLKHFNALQVDALIADIKTINLTKYVSEVAVAIVEAKLKVGDVNAAVQLCGVLHRIYADFSTHLLANWKKALTIKKDDSTLNVSKLRVDMRFFAECITSGIFTNKDALPILSSVLTRLINFDKTEHNNINLILNFCRHCGHDFAGLVPTKAKTIAKEFGIVIVRSNIVTEGHQQNVKSLIKDYYKSIYTHFLKAHKKLITFRHDNKMILQYSEDLTAERKATLEQIIETKTRLRVGIENFAELLNEVCPQLPDDSEEAEEDISLKIVGVSDWSDQTYVEDLWEDEEMRRFYEELPDISQFVVKKGQLAECNSTESSLDIWDIPDTLDSEEIDSNFNQEDTDSEPLGNSSNEIIEGIGEPEATSSTKKKKTTRELYFTNLINCVNRDMIDKASVDFVTKFNNTKANRKLLIDNLLMISWTRLDLLPFYARLIATLHPVISEIGTSVNLKLKRDFKLHLKKKDQLKAGSKIKTMRYIGELVKFGVYSKIEALFCVRLLLQDFSHHHIEMCCHLLESCGRYLFKHSVSRDRTEAYLEQMMRKKNVMSLDPRYVTMIENAYYYVNPPATVARQHCRRPVMHDFIRHLLYSVLDKYSVDHVLALMTKVNWHDADLSAYVIKCLTRAHLVKYYNIPHLAKLVNGLVRTENAIGVHVIDAVLEDIHVTVEMNLQEQNQRRIAMISYLGELYNYCLVDNIVIFNTLYFLISFGVSQSPDLSSPLDPPDNLIRIRLITVLLDSCGSFFDFGFSAKKLDYFIVFYENYYWTKRSNVFWTTNDFPANIVLLFTDSLLHVRPNLKLCKSYEESCCAVEKLKAQLITDKPEVYKVDRKASPPLPTIDEEDILTETEQCSKSSKPDINEELEREIRDNSREDNDFMSAFDQMVSDNMCDRLNEQVKQIDISVPFHIKGIVNQTENVESHAKFVLLTKKGNKQTYKQLLMPINSEIVAKIKQSEELERLDMERVKQLTLDINKRMGEAEYQEMLEMDDLRKGSRRKFVKLNLTRLESSNKIVFGSSC